MPANRRERRQRETMTPLPAQITQAKPEAAFSEAEEAFFRAGELLAEAPPPGDEA
jgi:hypothetical protein